jgi:hypothetical protein
MPDYYKLYPIWGDVAGISQLIRKAMTLLSRKTTISTLGDGFKRFVISMRGQLEMAGASFLQPTNDQSQQNAADRSLALASCRQSAFDFLYAFGTAAGIDTALPD